MNSDKDKHAPVFIPLIGGVFLLLAYWSAPLPSQIEWSRMLLVVGGITAIIGAAYNAIVNAVNQAIHMAADARWHWYEPIIRLTENTQKMDAEQIKYAREIGLVHEVFKVQPIGFDRYISTPWGSLTPDWIESHLELCFKTWPIFPAIGRYHEGSLEYKHEYAFNHWMTLWRLAEERPGREYVWKATKKEVTDRIYEHREEEAEESAV